MDSKFRNMLEQGNFLISTLVIRSLCFDDKKNKLTVDKIRLKDELYFYKFLEKNQKPSIISALYPIIYGNRNQYNAYEEAINLFYSIRKKITPEEKYYIFLLCKIIKGIHIEKEDIFNFSADSIDKDELVKLQKAKVESIINFNNILDFLFLKLHEDTEYKSIFSSNFLFKEDKYKDIICRYYENLCIGNINLQVYKSKNIENLNEIFYCSEGDEFSCSVIPNGIISQKITNEYGITVVLKTKNTSYKLIKGV
ncbi:MAG: hypothetical protein ACRDA4_09930 [Filifactoraceae bacterium]